MNAKLLKLLNFTLVATLMGFAGRPLASAQDAGQSPPAMPAEELPAGSQVLASGPVHEAFAKPVTMDPEAPLIVSKPPPANLQEVPPAEKPAGAGIVWVPGYWAWDASRNDFVWVSGCWRNAPPSTYWVPGYWLQTTSGWEWIGGFWKPIAAQPEQEIEYLPAPPAVTEVEPPGPPPLPDQVWVPGCWYWSQGQYISRPGYWITQQVGWVWVPSHYAWTPRGYIFCPGHWDYDLDNRGVLFTPVYFPPTVWVQTGFVYSPTVCVNLGLLQVNLFTYPRYRHYYFGDYYDDTYRHVGIYPWYKCQTVHIWYDPIFVYDRWHNARTNPRWADNQAHEFAVLRANRNLRPARTFAESQVQMARTPLAQRPERSLVQPLKTYATSESTPIKFERISNSERQQIAAQTTEVHQLRDQRNHWEGPAVSPAAGTVPVSKQAPAAGKVVNAPVARPTKWPAGDVSQPQIVPPQKVRVTQPERQILPNPSTTGKSSESRYIQKEPPGHPAQERSQSAPHSNQGSSNRDSRQKSQPNDSQETDRARSP